MSDILAYAIIGFGVFNLLRIATLMIATDWHDIRRHSEKRLQEIDPPVAPPSRNSVAGNPYISVIIPAYNEETGVLRSLESVLASDYHNFQVIVVDDGSRDDTAEVVRSYVANNKKAWRVKLVQQPNGGKASALNNAIHNHAYGSLVMCLDADSMIAPNALRETATFFKDNPYTVGMASNVHVLADDSLIGLAQTFEYMLSYRMKKALTQLNMEYIIGGVGSTFRKKNLKTVGLYDDDTMTEDIDLTLKLLSKGNKKHRVAYGWKVHTYTEGVQRYRDLIKQRFRWKFGRMQALYKNRLLILNRDKKYSKLLTMFQLPYALVGELNLFLEPLFFAYIAYFAITTQNYYSLIWIIVVIGFYMAVNIVSEESLSKTARLKLLLLMPVGYFMFYAISFIEFVALIKSLPKLRNINKSLDQKTGAWEHVQRATNVAFKA